MSLFYFFYVLLLFNLEAIEGFDQIAGTIYKVLYSYERLSTSATYGYYNGTICKII